MQDEEYQYEEEPEYDYENGEIQEEVPNHYQRGESADPEPEYKPYEILPLQKLSHELELILEQIHVLTCLSRGWCLLLLKEFKWDKDFLREEYYNDMTKYQSAIGFRHDLGDPANFLFDPAGTCDVCLSEGVQIIRNICNHGYCLQCWLGHIKGAISAGHSFPRCMEESCGAPVLLETVRGILALAQQQGVMWSKKYEKRLCQMFITTNRNYQFCTGIDCGNCIKINTLGIDTVTCVCGKVFCFRCQSDDHYPCKCDEKAKWAEQVLKQEADAKWIALNAKICPWCKKAVQRSMGCNFMACTCGKSFCYMCSQPWQPDHKDHFKCHIFKKRPDDAVNREKEVMERMSHCTERYIFNQAVANSYKQIDVFSKRKKLFKVLHIELTDSEFMQTAYRFAIECCEKLKWIYAFTYFHDMKNIKEAFEFSLGEYEKYKENLLKLIAVDLKHFMAEVEILEEKKTLTEQRCAQLHETFRNLKKSIVNYYTCTKNYKDKFVEELLNITQKLNSEKEKQMVQSLPMKKSKSENEEKEGGLINTVKNWVKQKKKKDKS